MARDGSQGGGKLKSPGTGVIASHSRSPPDWAGAASGRGLGHLLPPVRESCVFFRPPFRRGGSGSPLTATLHLFSPSPSWTTAPACRGSGCKVSAHGASVLGHLGLGGRGTNSTPSAGRELRQLRDCRCRCRCRLYWRLLVTLGGDHSEQAEEEEEEQGGWGWGEKVAIVPGGV